jgi:hypothetical protein
MAISVMAAIMTSDLRQFTTGSKRSPIPTPSEFSETSHTPIQSAASRIPAYGKDLLDLRRRGFVPKQHPLFGHVVIALDDWHIGKAIDVYRLVIPSNADPAAMSFSMIAGLEVVLVYATRSLISKRTDAALRAVMRFKPATLRVVIANHPKHGFWVLSHRRGLERPEYAS